jgi:hypothetical protein
MGEKFLVRVRQMDEGTYQKRKSFIIERHIERVERHVGVLSDEERAEEGTRVADIFGKARQLSDVDFEAQILFLDHLYGLLGAYGGTNTAPLTVVVVDLHLPRDLVPGDAEVRAEERADVAALAREGSQTPRGLGNGLLLGEPFLHQVEAPPPLFNGKGGAPDPLFPLELAGLGNHRGPSLIERN